MNCAHETTEFRRQRYEWNGRAWQKVKQCLICGERIPYSDKNPFWPEDFDNEIINLPAYDYKFLHKNDGKEIIAEDLHFRNPCKVCNNTTGFVTKSNMQHVAYCDNCGAVYAYNPSRADLGMKNETQTHMAKANQNRGQIMTFLKVKDGIINLNAIQYIRRVQSTITLYFESDFYDIAFGTEDEAIDYLCSMYSLLEAIEPEVSK
jgi:hypothetical protein